MADEFNPEYLQGGYSRRDAFAFAAACDLAYQIKPASAIVEATLKQQWGFTDVTIINKYLGGRIDTQGFVAANEGNILVAFAGSESFSDWWANVTFIAEPGPFKETKVHKGFKDALVPTLVRIAADSQKYNLTGEKKIWVAGHSLGGALAVLLTATLLADGIPVAGLYTYGAPRVGNSAFEEMFNAEFKDAYRVVNQDDVVPHLPPEFLGFSHSGKRILFDRQGRRYEDYKTWVKFQAMMGAWIAHIPKAGISVKGPHLLNTPEGYLRKLRDDVVRRFR